MLKKKEKLPKIAKVAEQLPDQPVAKPSQEKKKKSIRLSIKGIVSLLALLFSCWLLLHNFGCAFSG